MQVCNARILLPCVVRAAPPGTVELSQDSREWRLGWAGRGGAGNRAGQQGLVKVLITRDVRPPWPGTHPLPTPAQIIVLTTRDRPLHQHGRDVSAIIHAMSYAAVLRSRGADPRRNLRHTCTCSARPPRFLVSGLFCHCWLARVCGKWSRISVSTSSSTHIAADFQAGHGHPSLHSSGLPG